MTSSNPLPDLSAVEYRIVVSLDVAGAAGLSQSGVVRHAKVGSPSAVPALARLVAWGWVDRGPGQPVAYKVASQATYRLTEFGAQELARLDDPKRLGLALNVLEAESYEACRHARVMLSLLYVRQDLEWNIHALMLRSGISPDDLKVAARFLVQGRWVSRWGAWRAEAHHLYKVTPVGFCSVGVDHEVNGRFAVAIADYKDVVRSRTKRR